MRVEVRAVIMIDEKVVIAREQRHGHARLSIPGGRVANGESVEQALVREVEEETGLNVNVGPLLYAAEVTRPGSLHDLNLVFSATPIGPVERAKLTLLAPSERHRLAVLPPILDHIATDLAAGGHAGPRWLGNIWRPEQTSSSGDADESLSA